MANELKTTKFGNGTQATTMNTSDRLVFGDGTGKEYWINKDDFAAMILPLLAVVTPSANGLVGPKAARHQLSSMGTGQSRIIAKIPKIGGSIAIELTISAPTVLSSKLFLSALYYNNNFTAILKQLVAGGVGTPNDNSFKVNYLDDGSYINIYLTRAGVTLTIDVLYHTQTLPFEIVTTPSGTTEIPIS